MRWDSYGRGAAFASKYIGAFFLPTISLAIIAFILYLLEHESRREHVRSFSNHTDVFLSMFSLFFFYLNIILLSFNLNSMFPLPSIIAPGLSVIFWHAGILCSRNRKKGHLKNGSHPTGKYFKLSSVIILASVLLPSDVYTISVMASAIIAGSVASFAETQTNKNPR